jgi:hypothetical protein
MYLSRRDQVTRRGLINFARAGVDNEAAAGWHGVSRVDDQIDDDLLDLTYVREDAARACLREGHQFNVLADQAAQTVPKSKSSSDRECRRLNVKSCRARVVARFPAFLISSRLLRRGSMLIKTRSAWPPMTVSRLLKS